MTATPPSSAPDFRVGVMMMEVEGKDSARFNALVDRATRQLTGLLEREARLHVEVMSFEGPHLVPGAGAYSPLDFFQIAFSEKAERSIPFLLVVTEVDITAEQLAYTLALPSPLTNIAIVSTKRLDPSFWGEERDDETAATRLTRLLAHSFGHLVNLRPSRDPANIMKRVDKIEDLDAMRGFDADQWARMAQTLPREANERRTRSGRFGFALSMLARNLPQVVRAAWRANPLRLLARLPTMLAAALSVIIVLLFSAETWDVASAVSLSQVTLFSAISLAAAIFLLYRGFRIEAVMSRDRHLSESAVVTIAAALLSLFATLLVMYAAFALLMYGAIVTVFPGPLMESWPSVGEATSGLDHLKLSLFLAAMGVLAGSLGGRSDARDLVRGVIFQQHAG